ncbi:unnamed protein product [Phytophthora fragariaefolia]|uniref:Unnamed protein product n=1 Tax=Phytophthora fragariaefolia TaxID=1490495 RepID=A0A9W6WXW9_9STRA|nr:unnamed protein product [Phytophthora fragariaefolia]
MTATACKYSGDVDAAMVNYRAVMDSESAEFVVKAAIAAAELLSTRSQPREALEIIDAATWSEVVDESMNVTILCTRGWLHFQLGDLQQAQSLLEANASKIPATDILAKGLVFKRLAIVYWHLGGSYQTAKSGCFGYLLQAAKMTPSDAEIFGWLGKWYEEVAKDILHAEKCFLKALSLSPTDELAGMALSSLYDVQGKYDANVMLWERVTEDQETAPTWALLRLAQHLVEQNDESAVGKLHLALRNDPMNAQYWVILAHIYQNFDKQVSAQRSYLKAIELGEDNWCVRCELARIEGSLLLFDDALARIKPVAAGELSDGEPDVTVAFMIYADLLFQQAKYLCAEGLYGNAAANLKEASAVMKGLPSTSPLSGSVEACKLIGDIHCLAFYLSPDNFSSGGSSWIDFIRAGRQAYEAAVLLARKTKKEIVDGPDVVAAERYYDIGLSYWYEAQAQSNVRGVHTSAFSTEKGDSSNNVDAIVADLKAKASTNFKLALEEDPSCSLAWNGLAIVSDNLLVKQFAWTRAIQTGSSSDATWANLGMFYLKQADVVPSMASMAQKAFLQLQSMNPSNPSMWNGYAMLARRQATSVLQQRKTIEAFDCALQVGLDLDALLGLSMALLDYGTSIGESMSQAPEHGNEQVMFYLKKYLERDPFNAGAWHALGVTQHRLGLYTEALVSYTRAGSSSQTPEGLEWNTLLTKLGELSISRRDVKADEVALLELIAAQLKTTSGPSALQTIVQAQILYRQSKGSEALSLIQEMLSQDESQCEGEAVAFAGLAMASLLMDKINRKAIDLAVVCKDRLLASIDQAESALTTRDYLNLRLVGLHERFVGAEGAYLSRLQVLAQADAANSNALWMRLALATIDSQSFQVSSCLAEYLRSGTNNAPSPGMEAVDRNYLDTLVGLIKAGPSGDKRLYLDAQKLVRAQPWNPQAYVLASMSILKRIGLDTTLKSHDETLRQLLRLLCTGLSYAIDAEYEAAQLQLLTSYCYLKLGERGQAVANANKALERVVAAKESGMLVRSVDTDLLEARLVSISSPIKAIEKYLGIIGGVSTAAEDNSTSRLVPILIELGGLYEEEQYLDSAINVWKLVASLTTTKSPSTADAEDDASSTTTAIRSNSDSAACFFANLRLAIIHGKKNNVKPARKHIKAAVALADAGGDSNSVTVAAFVENVVAN